MFNSMGMVKVDYKLEIDYKELFKSWYEPMKELFSTNYMYNMMVFLNEGYNHKVIRPHKSNIFRTFREVPFSDVRVIIIGDEPYHDNSNTGLAYAQTESIVLNQEMTEIESCIERNHPEHFNLYVNSSLKHWVKQGVMPLHASLTVEDGIVGSHKFHWREFMRSFIKTINDNKPGTIFMLWGDDAKYYKQYINTANNYVLEAPSVKENIAKGWGWDSDCFSKCNKILKDNNGREFQIKW